MWLKIVEALFQKLQENLRKSQPSGGAGLGYCLSAGTNIGDSRLPLHPRRSVAFLARYWKSSINRYYSCNTRHIISYISYSTSGRWPIRHHELILSTCIISPLNRSTNVDDTLLSSYLYSTTTLKGQKLQRHIRTLLEASGMISSVRIVQDNMS